MSAFTDKEFSISLGTPLRLYEFSREHQVWRYTNADHEIVFYEQAYLPIPIADDGIRQTGQTAADTLTLTAPDDLPVVKLFAGHPPSAEIWLTIRDTHFGLPGEPDSALVVWIGICQSVRWTRPGEVEITCTSISASMGRMGLRLTYERSCPHCLFDSSCRVSRLSWESGTHITALDGASITVANLPNNYYPGGAIRWGAADSIVEHRAIEARDGLRLTLLSGTAGLMVGQSIVVTPGCNQTSAMCDDIYNNLLNYGGFRHMPGVSPFEAMLFY
ncbi:MAG: phage BR0599 family protein [Betaproteobacteria bacterium]|nr:phage BR0599 family protein [Betaproteobacteria bacterium]